MTDYNQNKPGHDLDTHHLLSIKEPGEVLIQLRAELAKPENYDIVQYAWEGKTFEDCLGRIGTMLDIALDGEYDVVQLCSMFIVAMRNRANGITTAHYLAPGLVNAELQETAGEISLLEIGDKDVTIAPSKPKPTILTDEPQPTLEKKWIN